jgi:hypothetical protein
MDLSSSLDYPALDPALILYNNLDHLLLIHALGPELLCRQEPWEGVEKEELQKNQS